MAKSIKQSSIHFVDRFLLFAIERAQRQTALNSPIEDFGGFHVRQ